MIDDMDTFFQIGNRVCHVFVFPEIDALQIEYLYRIGVAAATPFILKM